MSLRKGKLFVQCSSVKGFTLVELITSTLIMTMILMIVLSNGPEVSTRLALANEAYKTELLLRESQLQGSAVNSLAGQFGGVGVFFTRASSTEVLKFKDRVDTAIVRSIGIGNGVYDLVPINEKESILVLSKKNKIGKLCVANGTNPFVCNDGFAPPITTLNISYIRPKQTAHIFINSNTGVEYDSACIQFDSVKSPMPGYVKSLLVYKTGMITKKNGTCN
jgi:hypothetical protein